MERTQVLELHGIAKLYGRTVAVRSLDLALDAGETLALLGPNGSGKTTLLKIIAGAVAPTLGTGAVFGRDIGRRRARFRREIGFLSAETYLYEDLTARENLRFVSVMAGERPDPARLGRILEEVGLASESETRVRAYSSGMRRRLSLGRLLLLRPRLLLLDEPYNSLDTAAADLVDVIVRRAEEDGSATILATHDAERALNLAHRVAVMERGALVRVGPARSGRAVHAQHVG